MMILYIIVGLIFVVIGIMEIYVYRVLSKCLRIQAEGKVYVKIVSSEDIYGWVQNRDILAIQNSMRAFEEHIRIERKGSVDLIQVREIKSIQHVRSIVKIVIGNS